MPVFSNVFQPRALKQRMLDNELIGNTGEWVSAVERYPTQSQAFRLQNPFPGSGRRVRARASQHYRDHARGEPGNGLPLPSNPTQTIDERLCRQHRRGPPLTARRSVRELARASVRSGDVTSVWNVGVLARRVDDAAALCLAS